MSVSVSGSKVIVVGGGLAGLSAAHTVLEQGGRVLLLDKSTFMGGNSTKATSGINGALTSTQIKNKIDDSAEKFERDTQLGANGGKPGPSNDLFRVLTHESAPAVEWLINAFKLDLSLLGRLGGHSYPRTHRGKERFPGMTITYALMEKFEEIASAEPSRAQVICSARATELITEGDVVVGLKYEKDGKTYTERGPVIIATGGFGADFSKDGILNKVRPDLLHLPTTNGEHCTGDGIKMTQAVGGATIDLEWVQVHPTGLVHPNEPQAKVKFLAAEALRGVGGLLLDANGKRFCNELGTRDYVTGCMNKNKGPFRLVLNSQGIKEIEWHIKHYVGRGLMKHFKSGAELAKEIGVLPSVIEETFKQYNANAKGTVADPFGKKFFTNVPFKSDDEFAVAIVTPVVHYCMGGVQIDKDARIVKAAGAPKETAQLGGGVPIVGLYAGGEVAGGVHGHNRLGGSGLLGAVVFGRKAGFSASKYLFDQLSCQTANRRVGAVAGQLFQSVNITSSGNGITVQLGFDGAATSATTTVTSESATSTSAPTAAAAAAASPSSPPSAAPSLKEYSLEEVSKHASENDCWVVVNGQVLNATSFLAKHPGGKQAILLYSGKDATEEFNMMHKPDVVQKYAPEIVIGTLKK